MARLTELKTGSPQETSGHVAAFAAERFRVEQRTGEERGAHGPSTANARWVCPSSPSLGRPGRSVKAVPTRMFSEPSRARWLESPLPDSLRRPHRRRVQDLGDLCSLQLDLDGPNVTVPPTAYATESAPPRGRSSPGNVSAPAKRRDDRRRLHGPRSVAGKRPDHERGEERQGDDEGRAGGDPAPRPDPPSVLGRQQPEPDGVGTVARARATRACNSSTARSLVVTTARPSSTPGPGVAGSRRTRSAPSARLAWLLTLPPEIPSSAEVSSTDSSS